MMPRAVNQHEDELTIFPIFNQWCKIENITPHLLHLIQEFCREFFGYFNYDGMLDSALRRGVDLRSEKEGAPCGWRFSLEAPSCD